MSVHKIFNRLLLSLLFSFAFSIAANCTLLTGEQIALEMLEITDKTHHCSGEKLKVFTHWQHGGVDISTAQGTLKFFDIYFGGSLKNHLTDFLDLDQITFTRNHKHGCKDSRRDSKTFKKLVLEHLTDVHLVIFDEMALSALGMHSTFLLGKAYDGVIVAISIE